MLLLGVGLLLGAFVVGRDLGLVGLDARVDLADRAGLLVARLLIELLDLSLVLDQRVGLVIGNLGPGLGDLGLLLLVGVGVGGLDLGLGVSHRLFAVGVALVFGLGHLGLSLREVGIHLGLGHVVERRQRARRQVPLLELGHALDGRQRRQRAGRLLLGDLELLVELGRLDGRRAGAGYDLGLGVVERLGAVADRVLAVAEGAHRVGLARQVGHRRRPGARVHAGRGRRQRVDRLLGIGLLLRLVGAGRDRSRWGRPAVSEGSGPAARLAG